MSEFLSPNSFMFNKESLYLPFPNIVLVLSFSVFHFLWWLATKNHCKNVALINNKSSVNIIHLQILLFVNIICLFYSTCCRWVNILRFAEQLQLNKHWKYFKKSNTWLCETDYSKDACNFWEEIWIGGGSHKCLPT